MQNETHLIAGRGVSMETRVRVIRTIREKHMGTESPRDGAPNESVSAEDKLMQFCSFAADHSWG